MIVINTSNVTGRHRGPVTVPKSDVLCAVSHIFVYWLVPHVEGHPIIQHWVWYLVISLCYVCIQSSGIILIP